jgi:Ca2+-binding EF-hand superfamily protein
MQGLLRLCFLFGIFLLQVCSESPNEKIAAAGIKEKSVAGSAKGAAGAAATEAPHADELTQEDAEAADGAEDDETHADADDNSEEADADDKEDADEESVWTEEQISSDQIRNMHKKIDANNDGKVSMAEILDFSKSSRKAIVGKEALVVFDQMDSNKDGKISLEELIENSFGAPVPDADGVPITPKPSADQDADDARIKKEKELESAKFKAADANSDGFLDKAELPAAFYPEVNDGVLVVVAAASLKGKDKDGDGELTPEEFWEHEEGENEDVVAEQAADFAKLDTDHNGKLNLAEFKQWESGAYHTHDAMTQLFEVADEDTDHHVTASEMDNARPVLANTPATSHLVEWAEHYEL